MAKLGNNVVKCWQASGVLKLKIHVSIGVVVIKYLILPITWVMVEKLAATFGFLHTDPLFHFVLMIQFNLPSAMKIGNLSQQH